MVLVCTAVDASCRYHVLATPLHTTPPRRLHPPTPQIRHPVSTLLHCIAPCTALTPHRAARSSPHHCTLLPKRPARPAHLSIAIHPPILVVICKEGSSILPYLDLIPRGAGRSHWLLSPSPLFLIMLLHTSHARYRLAGLGGCPAGLSRLRSTYSS